MNPEITDDDPEVKPNVRVFSTVNNPQVTMDDIISRFSSWERLKKFAAWMLCYRENLYKTANKPVTEGSSIFIAAPVTVDEIPLAEEEILKYVQRKNYGKELVCLNTGVNIERNSSIL